MARHFYFQGLNFVIGKMGIIIVSAQRVVVCVKCTDYKLSRHIVRAICVLLIIKDCFLLCGCTIFIYRNLFPLNIWDFATLPIINNTAVINLVCETV